MNYHIIKNAFRIPEVLNKQRISSAHFVRMCSTLQRDLAWVHTAPVSYITQLERRYQHLFSSFFFLQMVFNVSSTITTLLIFSYSNAWDIFAFCFKILVNAKNSLFVLLWVWQYVCVGVCVCLCLSVFVCVWGKIHCLYCYEFDSMCVWVKDSLT